MATRLMPTRRALAALACGCVLPALLGGCGWFDPTARVSSGEQAIGTVRLAGLAEQADRVVYVVDMTGQGSQAHHYLLAELARSIKALDPAQRFGVVLFGARSPVVFVGSDSADRGQDRPWSLRPATAGDVAAACRFLVGHREAGPADEGACGRAVEAALGLAGGPPQAVYLVAQRPWLAGDLPERVARANAARPGRRPARINTIGFVDPRTADAMQRIARENGGRFQMIDATELGRF